MRKLGNYEIVASCYADALELYRGLDDRLGQAHTLNFLGIAQHVSDDYLAAEDTLKGALDLYRDLGHRLGQAEVLNNLGIITRSPIPPRPALTTSRPLRLRATSPRFSRRPARSRASATAKF